MARKKKTDADATLAPEATAPEAVQADPAPANEPEAQAAPPEPPEAPATTPEPDPDPEKEPEAPEAVQDPDPDADPDGDPAPEPEPEPEPPGERPLPYRATVGVALAVVRKAVGLGTADQLKPVGTLKQGAAVTVVDRFEGYAQLANGLWIDEDFLTV